MEKTSCTNNSENDVQLKRAVILVEEDRAVSHESAATPDAEVARLPLLLAWLESPAWLWYMDLEANRSLPV